MHISDGILATRYCIAGFGAAGVLAACALSKTRQEDISRVAVMSAAFFVSSLIHFKAGPTSVHLSLLGLMGITLGALSPLAIIAGLLFQALMFGHGGITTLGVNATIMAAPALLTFAGYRAVVGAGAGPMIRCAAGGALSGLGVFIGAGIMLAVLYLTGREFAGFAVAVSVAHSALALVEGVLSGVIIGQLQRIRPEALAA